MRDCEHGYKLAGGAFLCPACAAPVETPEFAQRRRRITTALGLLQSVIRSGEPWTESCYAAMEEAMDAYDEVVAEVCICSPRGPVGSCRVHGIGAQGV